MRCIDDHIHKTSEILLRKVGASSCCICMHFQSATEILYASYQGVVAAEILVIDAYLRAIGRPDAYGVYLKMYEQILKKASVWRDITRFVRIKAKLRSSVL